jgi:hypothetical protein
VYFRGNGIRVVNGVRDCSAKATDRCSGTTNPPTRQTGAVPWLDHATEQQRASLTDEQELAARCVHERVTQMQDWRELRDLACELDRSRGGNLAECIPDWVIDGFVKSIRERTADDFLDEFCGGDEADDPLSREAPANRGAKRSAPAAVSAEKLKAFRVKDPWPEHQWGAPNWIVRSALCSSFKNDAGYYGSTAEDMVLLHSLSNIIIRASGTRLHEGDLNSILMSIHCCRLGDSVETTPARFLRGMQRGTSTRDVNELIASLTRISNCHVEVSIKHRNSHRIARAWSGPLIRFEVVPKPNSKSGRLIRISLDPELGTFCGKDFTWIEVGDRAALRQHSMAAGLHAFYSTHVDPCAYSLELIRLLLGVETKGIPLEKLLRSALALLEKKGMILGAVIVAGKLTVTPKLTPTKLKFLAKKGITPTIVRTLPTFVEHTAVTAAATSGSDAWSPLRHARAAFRAVAGFITRFSSRGVHLHPPEIVELDESKRVDASPPL